MSPLRQRGISFDDHADPAGIIDFGPAQATWFKDSEGNLIQGTSPLWSR